MLQPFERFRLEKLGEYPQGNSTGEGDNKYIWGLVWKQQERMVFRVGTKLV